MLSPIGQKLKEQEEQSAINVAGQSSVLRNTSKKFELTPATGAGQTKNILPSQRFSLTPNTSGDKATLLPPKTTEQFFSEQSMRAQDSMQTARKFLFPSRRETLEQMEKDAQQTFLPTEELKQQIREANLGFAPDLEGDSFERFLDKPVIDIPDVAGMTKNITSPILKKLAKETDVNKVVKTITNTFPALKQFDNVETLSEVVAQQTNVNEIKNTLEFALAKVAPLESKRVPIRGEGGRFLGSFIDEPLGDVIKATDDGTLVAVHNISQQNLRNAKELGGLAKPSVAIVRPETQAFNNFGDITLVSPKTLIDPKAGTGSKVFGADVYSPRFPETTIRFKSSADEKRVNKELQDTFKKYIDDTIVEYRALDPDNIKQELETNPAILMRFLESKGIQPSIDISKIDIGDTSYSKFSSVRNQLMKQIRDVSDDASNEVFDFARKFTDELNATDTQFYAGRTPMGKQRYKPYTMDNALRLMGNAVRDSEGFDYGLGSTRANFTPQFKSIKAIKESENKIVDADTFTKVKEEVEDEFMKLVDEFSATRTHSGDSNSFIQFDYDVNAFKEYALNKRDSWITDNYKVTPALDKKINEFIQKLKSMPTEYFEAKFNRAVGVDEFTAAIVPEGTPKDLIKYLEDNGLRVETYIPDDSGLNRNEALKNVMRTQSGTAFAGGVAGIERDEEGNLTFDPVKAGLGIIGVGFAQRYGGVNSAKLNTVKSNRQFAQVESEIYTEMLELSQAGQRIILDDGTVKSMSSTFPNWVPEHLRSLDLFEKTLALFERGEMPKSNASRQMELYTEIVDEMARRMGIDTADNLMTATPKTKNIKPAVDPVGAITESRTIENRVLGSTESPLLTQNITREQVENHQSLLNTTKSSSYKDSITKTITDVDDAKFQQGLFSDEDVVPDLPEFTRQLNTALGDTSLLKDISGFKGQARDMYRNTEMVFGENWNKIKKVVFDPFDKAKGAMVDEEKTRLTELAKNVTDFGIKKGSKESAAVMDFGEKLVSKDELIAKFGQEKADTIVKAANWFRQQYDSMLDEVNAVRASIYPTNPEKLIPKRKDYFRHYQELSQGFEGLKNIFETPSLGAIDPKLAGISAFTQPKSKWLSFAQQRLGFTSERDAVGGFLNYLPNFAYAKHIDPHIGRFRVLRKELANKTTESRNINNYLEALNDYANDLAGKTNPADRYIQTVIPYGRQAFQTITWLNNRVKVNTILGNVSSSIAQAFNVPQGIGSAKMHSVYGAVRTFGDIYHDTAIKNSNFIKERYKQSAYNKFDVSMLDKGRNFAGWMIGVLDEVGTKFIWNSHYEKAIREGIPEPVQYADEITRKLVAGRGIGEVPLMQKSKVFQLVAPFQLEVGNLWYVLGDKYKQKDFSAIATTFLAMYLMNRAAEEIRGSDVGFDPVQALYEAYQIGVSDMSADEKAFKMSGRLTGEVLSNVPLGQTVAAMYPEYGFKLNDYQTPVRSELFGDGDPTRYGSGLLVIKGLQDPLFKVLPPYAGSQIKKSIQGIDAFIKGDVTDAQGRKLYSVEGSIPSLAQNALFGKYSTNEARTYFDSKDAKPKIKAEIEKLYNENQALIADGKDELAQSNVDQLSDEMYEIYKQVKADKKRETTNEAVKNMLPTVRQARALIKEGREDEAQAIVDAMTDDEYRYYELAKDRLDEDDHSEVVSERSLIKTIATYAYAFGTDPATAFNLMFSGEKIRRVDNGAIIVERMSLEESSKIKTERGAVGGMYLDHTIPLQLGGTNDPSNLLLVEKNVWESYTPVENALGKALRDDKITKQKAQSLILQFKNGSLSAEQVLSEIPQ